MRVLLVSYGYSQMDLSKHSDVNSEALSTYYLSNALKREHEITIITKDKSEQKDIIHVPCNKGLERIEEKITGRGVGQLKLDYPQFIYKAYRIAKSRIRSFDIIHQISPKSFRYPSPLGNLKIPFLLGPVGGSIPYPKGFEEIEKREKMLVKLRGTDKFRLNFDPLLRSTMLKAARILVTSNAALDILPERYRGKAVVVPQGIYLKRGEGDKQPDNLGRRREYIFSSGRLVPYKGMDLLIRAFAMLRPKPELELLITGDGPERQALIELINSLGAQDSIKLLGKVQKEENLALMRGARFCVFAALNEAFGAVNLEAMAAGKPIIVTDWGGPADVVEQGVTGFKVIGRGVEEYIENMTQRIQLLVENDELCRSMGFSALEKVKKEFTWEAIADSIGRIYVDVAK